MAYVLPTLVAMGFGYAITELALKQPLIGLRWAWAGFWLVIAGTVMAAATMARRQGVGALHVLSADDRQPVLLPRRRAGRRRLVDLGRAHVDQPARVEERRIPGATVPLAMFGNVAGAYLWAWTSVGAAVEVLVLILPASLGLTDTINAGLARVFFSWTLHAIVYFWLMPALHRLLHDRAARHRRAPVQRHDGPGRVRAVPRVLDADRHPPPVRRPAGRRRLQVRARGDDGDGVGADAADGVHDRRVGRDRRRACAAARACSAGSRRCPGTTR